MQLLIPYALVDTPDCARIATTLQLPVLEQLLRRMSPTATDQGSEQDLSTPHERQLARAVGLPIDDGRIALAALALAQSGADPGQEAWAWVTPAHWQVGVDHILMLDPATLQLQEDESRALQQAMAPYFAQDGITLSYLAPERWLACGAPLQALRCASLDRVIGADVGPWMPDTAPMRRLQNEMQMLLYSHPANDARIARGLAGVNSFWISGAGCLAKAPALPRAPVIADALRAPALGQDWAAWARAWSDINQGPCRALLAELDAARPARLTLCSARRAVDFDNVPVGWAERIRRRMRPLRLHNLTGQL